MVLLSGEESGVPVAEAKALFLAYDPGSTFELPEKRVLVAHSRTDPFVVSSRIAFARRVGRLLGKPEDASDAVDGKRVRVRSFALGGSARNDDHEESLRGLNVRVDLEHPEYELTVVTGRRRYFALTDPLRMKQDWRSLSPRRRAFFHPSAIFPKLSRALVNLTRCREGDVFLDPFAGTGSLPLEAHRIGARVVALDLSRKMAEGSLANMRKFGQEWLGSVAGDSLASPIRRADAIATDVPYGRASSTGGAGVDRIVGRALEALPLLLSPGSRAVMMHPKDAPVGPSSDWTVEEEHDLYVHKRLTRTISILRRV